MPTSSADSLSSGGCDKDVGQAPLQVFPLDQHRLWDSLMEVRDVDLITRLKTIESAIKGEAFGQDALGEKLLTLIIKASDAPSHLCFHIVPILPLTSGTRRIRPQSEWRTDQIDATGPHDSIAKLFRLPEKDPRNAAA
eukprot:scaffold610475_cov14-Prasinocladus_malaysianus.AAC.1